MSYFDLHDILLEEEKVPSETEIICFNLAPLKGSSIQGSHLPAHTSLELPLWMIPELREKAPEMLSFKLPRVFNSAHRNMLLADADVINLYEWCPYFYRYGLRILGLNLPQTEELARNLEHAFGVRYPKILALSQNATEDFTSTQQRRLDHMERQLFQAGRRDDQLYTRWVRRHAHHILAAPAADHQPVDKRARYSGTVSQATVTRQLNS